MVHDIAAIYNAVLDRDPASADLVSAQTEVATGVGMDGLMSWLANSTEVQSDMDSTYAAVGASRVVSDGRAAAVQSGHDGAV